MHYGVILACLMQLWPVSVAQAQWTQPERLDPPFKAVDGAPGRYWRLTLPEFNTLADFMQEYAREMERASHAG